MAETFKDTSLNDVAKIGGVENVGAGSLGATYWVTTMNVAGVWKSTSLEDVASLGGVENVGAGSLGATYWVTTL